MLVMSLWMGQTTLTESRVLSLAWGVCSVTLAGLAVEYSQVCSNPKPSLTKKLALSQRIILMMVGTGLVASLLIFLTPSI